MQLRLFPPLPPDTDDELRSLYAGLPRVRCAWYGGLAAQGSVCPRSIRCPICRRGPGQRCKRPNEHDAVEMHATRWHEAEAIDRGAGGRHALVPDRYQAEIVLDAEGQPLRPHNRGGRT